MEPSLLWYCHKRSLGYGIYCLVINNSSHGKRMNVSRFLFENLLKKEMLRYFFDIFLIARAPRTTTLTPLSSCTAGPRLALVT